MESDLSELDLEITYRADSARIVQDFYVPCLMRSRQYRRAVGYFTSSGLAQAASGVAHLIKNNGSMELIASPNLSEEDVQAMQNGYESREKILERVISITFQEVHDTLIRDRLSALAWLISLGKLDIKLALRQQSGKSVRGMYHEKIGIFTDQNQNSIAFAGSSNETAGGLVDNFESIEVYWSWDDTHKRVERKIKDFEKLWRNDTKNLEIIDFTDATDELLRKYKTDSPPFKDFLEAKKSTTTQPSFEFGVPRLPKNITLRDYQQQALENWFKNNGQGILKMATGSGKTIVGLSIASALYEKISLEALVIICPYKHLVKQWEKEINKFGVNPLLAFDNRVKWVDKLTANLYDVRNRRLPFIAVITTNDSFIGALQSKLKYFPNKSLLIADEVHNVGAERIRQGLPDNFNLRLGLSATPERWFDDEGTEALLSYFGKVLEPQFTLKEAIQKKALVPYHYFPIFVELYEDELDEYLDLTKRIGQIFNQENTKSDDKILTALISKRARIIALARNKMTALRELMSARLDSSHMLFYCGVGTVEDDTTEEMLRHVDAVCQLLGNDLGFRISKYTAETPLDEREDLREGLASGQLQGLVAIRCLDEGIDIPSIKSAVILASSSNPRQFIQRRGRILRPSPGKSKAEIFDMIVIPPMDIKVTDTVRNMVRKELQRFAEFADLAINSGVAREQILEIQKKFHLFDI